MSESAQESIRRYLDFLTDPKTAVDTDAVAVAEHDVEEAKRSGDTLAELTARAALTRAKQADGSDIEAAFVSQARSYAQDNDIPAAAFADMGVPSDVLRRAGLVSRGRSGAGRSVRASGSKRASIETIRAHIDAMGSGTTFSLSELQEAIGGSLATLRKGVELMPDTKVTEVTDQAVIAKHSSGSRGRAPKVWARS